MSFDKNGIPPIKRPRSRIVAQNFSNNITSIHSQPPTPKNILNTSTSAFVSAPTHSSHPIQTQPGPSTNTSSYNNTNINNISMMRDPREGREQREGREGREQREGRSEDTNTNSNEEEKGSNVRVMVRIRPTSTQERSNTNHINVVSTNGPSEIKLLRGKNTTIPEKTFTYDHVFDSYTDQQTIFQQAAVPIIEEVLMGYNCTIFAYGQTGTGKTHTMEGSLSNDSNDPNAGIIPRCVHTLFERLRTLCEDGNEGDEYSVKVSFLEIYNEDLIDLLSDDTTKTLRIYEGTTSNTNTNNTNPHDRNATITNTISSGMLVQGLEERIVESPIQAFQMLQMTQQRRKVAETNLNKNSSRSHFVFTVTIHRKIIAINGEDVIKTGKLHLVDLAGSECIGKSGAQNQRAKEAGKINQSLLTLGRVINALVEKQPYIPYRDSKLTRLLQESLGGRSKTCIIATVTASSLAVEESLSTLEYANRAKNIKNKPQLSAVFSKKYYMAESAAEIRRLQAQVLALRAKNGHYLSPEEFALFESNKLQVAEFENVIQNRELRLGQMESILTLLRKQISITLQKYVALAVQQRTDEKTLYHTKKSLGYTIEELAQSEYIVHALKNTEKQLLSEATKTYEVATTSLFNQGILHDKYEKSEQAHIYNSTVTDQITNYIQDTIGDSIHQIQEVSTAIIDANTAIEECLDQGQSHITEKSNEITNVVNTFDEIVSTETTKVKQHVDTVMENVTDTNRDVAMYLEKYGTTLQGAMVEYLHQHDTNVYYHSSADREREGRMERDENFYQDNYARLEKEYLDSFSQIKVENRDEDNGENKSNTQSMPPLQQYQLYFEKAFSPIVTNSFQTSSKNTLSIHPLITQYNTNLQRNNNSINSNLSQLQSSIFEKNTNLLQKMHENISTHHNGYDKIMKEYEVKKNSISNEIITRDGKEIVEQLINQTNTIFTEYEMIKQLLCDDNIKTSNVFTGIVTKLLTSIDSALHENKQLSTKLYSNTTDSLSRFSTTSISMLTTIRNYLYNIFKNTIISKNTIEYTLSQISQNSNINLQNEKIYHDTIANQRRQYQQLVCEVVEEAKVEIEKARLDAKTELTQTHQKLHHQHLEHFQECQKETDEFLQEMSIMMREKLHALTLKQSKRNEQYVQNIQNDIDKRIISGNQQFDTIHEIAIQRLQSISSNYDQTSNQYRDDIDEKREVYYNTMIERPIVNMKEYVIAVHDHINPLYKAMIGGTNILETMGDLPTYQVITEDNTEAMRQTQEVLSKQTILGIEKTCEEVERLNDTVTIESDESPTISIVSTIPSFNTIVNTVNQHQKDVTNVVATHNTVVENFWVDSIEKPIYNHNVAIKQTCATMQENINITSQKLEKTSKNLVGNVKNHVEIMNTNIYQPIQTEVSTFAQHLTTEISSHKNLDNDMMIYTNTFMDQYNSMVHQKCVDSTRRLAIDSLESTEMIKNVSRNLEKLKSTLENEYMENCIPNLTKTLQHFSTTTSNLLVDNISTGICENLQEKTREYTTSVLENTHGMENIYKTDVSASITTIISNETQEVERYIQNITDAGAGSITVNDNDNDTDEKCNSDSNNGDVDTHKDDNDSKNMLVKTLGMIEKSAEYLRVHTTMTKNEIAPVGDIPKNRIVRLKSATGDGDGDGNDDENEIILPSEFTVSQSIPILKKTFKSRIHTLLKAKTDSNITSSKLDSSSDDYLKVQNTFNQYTKSSFDDIGIDVNANHDHDEDANDEHNDTFTLNDSQYNAEFETSTDIHCHNTIDNRENDDLNDSIMLLPSTTTVLQIPKNELDNHGTLATKISLNSINSANTMTNVGTSDTLNSYDTPDSFDTFDTFDTFDEKNSKMRRTSATISSPSSSIPSYPPQNTPGLLYEDEMNTSLDMNSSFAQLLQSTEASTLKSNQALYALQNPTAMTANDYDTALLGSNADTSTSNGDDINTTGRENDDFINNPQSAVRNINANTTSHNIHVRPLVSYPSQKPSRSTMLTWISYLLAGKDLSEEQQLMVLLAINKNNTLFKPLYDIMQSSTQNGKSPSNVQNSQKLQRRIQKFTKLMAFEIRTNMKKYQKFNTMTTKTTSQLITSVPASLLATEKLTQLERLQQQVLQQQQQKQKNPVVEFEQYLRNQSLESKYDENKIVKILQRSQYLQGSIGLDSMQQISQHSREVLGTDETMVDNDPTNTSYGGGYNRSRSLSRSNSRTNSRSNSRSNSRPNSRPNSRSNSKTKSHIPSQPNSNPPSRSNSRPNSRVSSQLNPKIDENASNHEFQGTHLDIHSPGFNTGTEVGLMSPLAINRHSKPPSFVRTPSHRAQQQQQPTQSPTGSGYFDPSNFNTSQASMTSEFSETDTSLGDGFTVATATTTANMNANTSVATSRNLSNMNNPNMSLNMSSKTPTALSSGPSNNNSTLMSRTMSTTKPSSMSSTLGGRPKSMATAQSQQHLPTSTSTLTSSSNNRTRPSAQTANSTITSHVNSNQTQSNRPISKPRNLGIQSQDPTQMQSTQSTRPPLMSTTMSNRTAPNTTMGSRIPQKNDFNSTMSKGRNNVNVNTGNMSRVTPGGAGPGVGPGVGTRPGQPPRK